MDTDVESIDWGQGLRVAIRKKVADNPRADSSPINRSMFVGIASALATKASPVAPEKRPLDVESCVYIERIDSAAIATRP